MWEQGMGLLRLAHNSNLAKTESDIQSTKPKIVCSVLFFNKTVFRILTPVFSAGHGDIAPR